MSMSPDVMRTGHKYRLINLGDVFEFRVLSFKGEQDFVLQDLHTLEKYRLSDLIKYGKGKDYVLEEWE